MTTHRFIVEVLEGRLSQLDIEDSVSELTYQGQPNRIYALRDQIKQTLSILEGKFYSSLQSDYIDWSVDPEGMVNSHNENLSGLPNHQYRLSIDDLPTSFDSLVEHYNREELSESIEDFVKTRFFNDELEGEINDVLSDFFQEANPLIAVLSSQTRKDLIRYTFAKVRLGYIKRKLDEQGENPRIAKSSINVYLPSSSARRLFAEYISQDYSPANISYVAQRMKEDRILLNTDEFDRNFLDSLQEFISTELKIEEEVYISRIDGMKAIKGQNKKELRYKMLKEKYKFN